MARPKRTVTQREADLAETARMDRLGYNQFQIARALGVSQGMVSMDLKKIRQRYQKIQMLERGAAILEKLEQYRILRVELMEAWEKSKKDTETVEVIESPKIKLGADLLKTGSGKEEGEESLRIARVTTIREGRLPEAEYLRQMVQILEAERKMLGLDEATKTENTVTGTLDWRLLYQPRPIDSIDQKIKELTLGEPKPLPPKEGRNGTNGHAGGGNGSA